MISAEKSHSPLPIEQIIDTHTKGNSEIGLQIIRGKAVEIKSGIYGNEGNDAKDIKIVADTKREMGTMGQTGGTGMDAIENPGTQRERIEQTIIEPGSKSYSMTGLMARGRRFASQKQGIAKIQAKTDAALCCPERLRIKKETDKNKRRCNSPKRISYFHSSAFRAQNNNSLLLKP